ncbi:MAG: SpoIIE family protein phosphatase [Spirochaetes bacterium]|nr:SpoIIE family protein phosphatase [Spirochaetota bacterium]
MNLRQLPVVALLILALAVPLAADSERIVIDDSFESMEIGDRVDFVEDASQKLTIDDIAVDSAGWKRSAGTSFNFGFATPAYWFRFTLENRQVNEKGVYLEISYPMLDFIELYIPQQSGGYLVKKSGDHYPFYDREIVDRNFIFYIPPGAGTLTCYLRIQSSSSVNFKPILWSQRSYLRRVNTEFPLFWIYYGLMMVMVLYNLFLFLSIRELRYIYYSMFITAFILFQLTLNGLAFQYLWPNLIWWANNSLPFLMCFTCFSAGVFVRSYLDSKRTFPRLDRVLFYFSIVPCFVWAVASLVFSYRISILGATFMALYSAIIMYGSGVVGFYYKSRAGRYIVIGFTMLVIGVAFFVLKTFGLLPTNLLTQWSIQIGSSLIVVLLSLGLADEINVMKKELEVLNVNLTDMNNNLEQKVWERTRELEQARDQIWGEMQLAKKIQTILLPLNPRIPGYEISAYMSPADDVGGDYYDIINVEGSDWVVIGDVSGHGVPAGIIMMMVQTAIHTAIVQNPGLHPSQLLAVINRSITENIKQLSEDKYMTITVFAAHREGRFHFSGLHQDVMIYRAERSDTEVISTNGMWLGIMDDISGYVCDETLSMDVGDCMLVYTDGITEARMKGAVRDDPNIAEFMFGDKRLKDILTRLGSRSTEEIKNGILDDLAEYLCNDDVTMVVLKRVE